jgi:hypothetical protein
MEQEIVFRIINFIVLIWVVYKTKQIYNEFDCAHSTVHDIERSVEPLETMLPILMEHFGLSPEVERTSLDLDKKVREWDEEN